MAALADLIAKSLWDGPSQEEAVFATRAPATIAALVDDWCVDHLASSVSSAQFWTASSACVSGLTLADDRAVVVKCYPASAGVVHVTAVLEVQARLADTGYPCARPIGGPHPIGVGVATAETDRPDPGMSHTTRAHSAKALAQLVDRCRRLPAAGLSTPMLTSATLYPDAHHPVYDLDATSDGAAWIDALAVRALASLGMDRAEPVIGHLDWSARNVRIDRGGFLMAVYDWASLAVAPESVVVGRAAVNWCLTGEAAGPAAPDLAGVEGFLEDYDGAITRPLTGVQWRAAKAAALWMLCYLARLEHALRAARPQLSTSSAATTTLRRDYDALLR